MALSIALPDRYAWVVLAGVGTGWLSFWQASYVMKYRKLSKIAYPQIYAEKAEAAANKDAMKFNCAQRAHQNTLEVLPHFLFYLLFTGIKYPTVSAGLGATWLVGRVFYTTGYVTGEPAKRSRGGFGTLALLGLMLTATYTAGELVYATL